MGFPLAAHTADTLESLLAVREVDCSRQENRTDGGARTDPEMIGISIDEGANNVARPTQKEQHVHEGSAGPGPETLVSTVLHTGGVHLASEKTVVERALSEERGVASVECNPVSQTSTVRYDPRRTSVAELQACIRGCGYHCAGESVPSYIGKAVEPPAQADAHAVRVGAAGAPRPATRAAHEEMVMAPEEAMGHGGHAGMSMAAMVRDMRNRFLVALVLSIPIVLWSPIGRQVLGFGVPAPFGLRDDIFQLILSLPVVFYSARIFFEGAVRALRQRTLDMMVLVAVAIGTGWLYSVVITLAGGGDVFYEAASVLATFVLLGHWFEMRARGGANDAIRTLLDLAPPMAVVIRDGEPVEVPTAQVAVGDLLLIRPGAKIPVDATVEEGESEVDESMVTGESLPGREDAGLGADRGVHQHQRHPARQGLAGRLGHRPRADRQAGPGSAELEGTQPAAGRPRRLLAGARGVGGRHEHAGGVVARRGFAEHGRAVCHHRRRHHLPGRARAGHADRHHGRHGPGRQARHPVQERHGARGLGPHPDRRDG